MLRPNISSTLCVYGGYTVSEDNIATFSNDTNVPQQQLSFLFPVSQVYRIHFTCHILFILFLIHLIMINVSSRFSFLLLPSVTPAVFYSRLCMHFFTNLSQHRLRLLVLAGLPSWTTGPFTGFSGLLAFVHSLLISILLYLEIYTVSRTKEATKLWAVTLSNLNRF